jgi:hypothetical protein
MAGSCKRYCYYTKGWVRADTILPKHKGLKIMMSKSYLVVILFRTKYDYIYLLCSYNLNLRNNSVAIFIVPFTKYLTCHSLIDPHLGCVTH